MKRQLILALVLVFSASPAAMAGVIASTFEDQGLAPNSFNNNAGPSGFFVSEGNRFNNSFDPSFGGIWSGWAISTVTDVADRGDLNYTNQYSAITGSGAGGSPTYGVAFTFGGAAVDPFHPAGSFVNLAPGSTPVSIDVTNTTYDYYSMKNGDAFESAFPTTPGSFLKLDVAGYSGLNGTGAVIGDVGFYLANFLGGNAYIVDAWQTVDLRSLAGAESLVFGLQSSANDPDFGMNTPAFFAADNLEVTTNSPVFEPAPFISWALGLLGAAGLYWKNTRMSAAV